jgi:hypothetical protein
MQVEPAESKEIKGTPLREWKREGRKEGSPEPRKRANHPPPFKFFTGCPVFVSSLRQNRDHLQHSTFNFHSFT